MMACLERCDAQTLCQLKAVSAGWQQRARRALFGRRSDVEVDVEELQHIGRLAAARQMPNLARLRGYGFTVEKNIGFGYLPEELSKPGTQVELDSFDSRIPAVVASRCLHDSRGERARS